MDWDPRVDIERKERPENIYKEKKNVQPRTPTLTSAEALFKNGDAQLNPSPVESESLGMEIGKLHF